MATSSSASRATALAVRLIRGVSRHRKVRAIKARLDELADQLAGWLAPVSPGGDLQPIRIRNDRPSMRRRP